MRWFRFYDEVLDNIKVQSLPSELFKFWVNILCVTSRCDKPVTLQETLHVTNKRVSYGRGEGFLPSLSEISFYLRMPEDIVKKNLDALIKANLIDNGEVLKIHNWEKRQYKSDTSNERVANYRAKEKEKKEKCNVTRNVTCNNNETSKVTHQNTDTDTDIKDLSVPNGTLGQNVQKLANLRFDDFWKVYPRKVKRKDAEKVWKREKLDLKADLIIADVINRKEKHLPWQDKKFIPYPTTYLNGDLWNDEIQTNEKPVCSELQEKIKGYYRELLEPLPTCLALNQWTSEDIKNLQTRIDENSDYQKEEAWRELFVHLSSLKKIKGEQKMRDGNLLKISLSNIVTEKSFAAIHNGWLDDEIN
jgi:hypothetical protein